MCFSDLWRLPPKTARNPGTVFGFGVALCLWQVLKQCGSDFSRTNILKQAASLQDTELPALLPGIRTNTSATHVHSIRSMQLTSWNGAHSERFGKVPEGATA